MRAEPQVLEVYIGSIEMEEGENVNSSDAFRKSALGGKVGADCGVGVSMV